MANEKTITRISGWRVGTHIKDEEIVKKEYYVNSKNLRRFGKNPKILKSEDAAVIFMHKIRKSTNNEDLFIDPIYVQSEI